ncbi:MAG TPA: M14 family metallopeptidase, partial [Chloroflexota bacterium]|nr:M14 family metallopeptidase [Chloroflexota bacterium]
LARVRLRAPSPGASLAWACGDAHGAVPLRPAHGVRVRVVELEVADHTDPAARPLTAVIALDGPDEEARHGRAILRALGHLWRAGLDPAPGVSRTWAIRVEGEASDTSLIAPESRRVPPGRLGAGDLALRGSDEGRPGALDDEAKTAGDPVPWDRVLSREEVNRAISRLGALPHVHSFVAGWSALGRPLWAMEVTAPRRRGWWSRAKLSGWKCSLLLNGRHHANEPASTSAMLRLAELLATEDAERRFLDRVNVIFLPGENADGMDLDDALVAEHPNWMHHAARYNAAGLEFTSAYRDPATPHTEALALPALWRQWAPDIVCDNHGFPSHAWEQPFSGHANPWFRAFWIPQALIYAYLPSADTPEHRTATQAIGERLVEMLGSDSEIARWNDQHALHYKTYLHNQLPERFPAPYERGVLLHRSIHDPKEGDPGMTGHAGRFSAVTTASLITEVADETAQGDYLALCARAHLLANRALLEYLYQANGPAGVRRIMARTPDGRTLLRATRPRPVQPQANWPDQMARRAGPGPSDPIASP